MLARGSRTDITRLARVLVAEPDPELRAELVALLGKHCDVIEATNGAEALDKTADLVLGGDRLPDVFVLTVQTPMLSGLHVMCAVRGCDRHVPIILMTAREDHATRALADHFGAALVEKPFDVPALCAAILELGRDPSPRSPVRVIRTSRRVDRTLITS